jgi:hypothetical protein
LGFRSTSELAVEVFDRVGAPQGLPHRLGVLVEGQQLEASFFEASCDGGDEGLPFAKESIVGLACRLAVLGKEDLVPVALELGPRVGWAVLGEVAPLMYLMPTSG